MMRLRTRGHWQHSWVTNTAARRWGVSVGKGCLSSSEESFFWRCWHVFLYAGDRCYVLRTPFYHGPSKASVMRYARLEELRTHASKTTEQL